jgi:uncharacterized 2Fe-2S/4Fe-4S cluster protein (DUF4445 family)
MKTHQVIFQPSGRRGAVPEGETLLEAARALGVGIESICGGQGTCGKCKVKLVEGAGERDAPTSRPGHLTPFAEAEARFIDAAERAQGFRLACAAAIRGDLLIDVPEQSRTGVQVARKGAGSQTVSLNPAVRLVGVTLPPPDLADPRGDYERLAAALAARLGGERPAIDHPALRALPGALRQGRWSVTVALWQEREIIAVFPGVREEACGLAIDVGSTTIAAYLCSLTTGRLLAAGSLMNPQVAFGEDVMARISYTQDHPEDGLERLTGAVREGINGLIGTITAEAGLAPGDILDLTVVGNTAMHHLLLGIDPAPLGVSPFAPAVHRSLDIKARDLSIAAHPGANLHTLPIEAGFVGADNVGVLIALEPHRQDEMLLIIDVGTNGEMLLGNRERLLSASCATGPALEGAHIRFGMRAAPGAIERIRIDPRTREVSFATIGDGGPPGSPSRARGICGSGIIDGVAELYRAGIIDGSGRFRGDVDTPRLLNREGRREFVIAWPEETVLDEPITIGQQDVRSVQLAKAALYAGAKLMMKQLGITALDRVVLAGAFGSYIDPEKAMALGLFPDCDLARVSSAGNAAGDGARICLLDRGKRIEAEAMARQVQYLELTTEADFQEEFLAALAIPHASDPFPHLPTP